MSRVGSGARSTARAMARTGAILGLRVSSSAASGDGFWSGVASLKPVQMPGGRMRRPLIRCKRRPDFWRNWRISPDRSAPPFDFPGVAIQGCQCELVHKAACVVFLFLRRSAVRRRAAKRRVRVSRAKRRLKAKRRSGSKRLPAKRRRSPLIRCLRWIMSRCCERSSLIDSLVARRWKSPPPFTQRLLEPSSSKSSRKPPHIASRPRSFPAACSKNDLLFELIERAFRRGSEYPAIVQPHRRACQRRRASCAGPSFRHWRRCSAAFRRLVV